ncbi:MAG TPA: YeeE/YedE thiosulfate transporter family protein, partial [Geminicoccaceae bacterium]
MTARPAPGIAARPKAALDPRIEDGPAASVDPRTILRWSLAALVVLGLGFASDALLAQPRGASLSLSLILGALFGFVLQRSRFCFLCHWRDFLDARDPRGILAILAALAVGVAGYTVVYGAWMPDPSGTRLPPGAHIGPVGPVLIAAGLSFGAGMAISGSCISAHLYRLGEGSPTAPFALLGSGAGFALGFLTWNPLYLASISEAPILWLPRLLGYTGALLAALA